MLQYLLILIFCKYYSAAILASQRDKTSRNRKSSVALKQIRIARDILENQIKLSSSAANFHDICAAL